MANFPTSLDSLTNVQDGVDYPKAADINNLNDAVEAVQAKVGIDDSAVATSIEYIINNKIWPVGSVFTAVVATDPAILLGFGTWSRIAEGRCLVGQTDSDADFNSAEETSGSKTINIAHTHTGTSHTHTGPNHAHTGNTGTTGDHAHSIPELYRVAGDHGTEGFDLGKYFTASSTTGNSGGNHSHSFTTDNAGTGNTGASGTGNTSSSLSSTQSVVQPSLVVYFWKRTA